MNSLLIMAPQLTGQLLQTTHDLGFHLSVVGEFPAGKHEQKRDLLFAFFQQRVKFRFIFPEGFAQQPLDAIPVHRPAEVSFWY